MTQQTNFPISNSAFVDQQTGFLTKEGRTLLRALWVAGPGAPVQKGWGGGTASASQGPLSNYTGGTTPTNMAAQIVLLTDVVGTLINALIAKGTLSS